MNDLVNLVLLVAAAPLVAFLARLSSRRMPFGGRAPLLSGLAWAAAPGVVVAAVLVLPGSPAQDWDLMALTILPAAVLAIAAAQPLLSDAPVAGRIGLGLLSASTLLAFVLVNADPLAGPRRFAALIGEGSVLSPHEQAYGNEKLVQYHVARGENEAALGYAERMVRAEPTNPRYWVKAGATLCNMNRYLEAAPYFEEALRRAPGRADAMYNLGLCYARTQRIPEAIAAFRAAVAADPAQPDYRHNLGVVLYSAGQPDSARAVWEDLLRRWPGYPLTVRAWERRFGAPPPSYASPSSSSPSSSNPR
jgi:tetratricopeptide (TPR) repeat protein